MVFLDTNICIYFLTGRYPVIRSELLALNPDDVKIPVMVKAELLYGAAKSRQAVANREKVLQFLEPFEIVPFDNGAAEAYADIRADAERAGASIGPNDLVIAAIVLSHQGVLVTNNEKEFRRVPGLGVENWVGSARMT